MHQPSAIASAMLALVWMVCGGCHEHGPAAPSPVPCPVIPEIPIRELEAAPDSLILEGERIHVEVEAYRDAFPILGPPTHRPLVVSMHLTAVDADSFPSVEALYVWAIKDSTLWGCTLQVDRRIPYPRNELSCFASDGPEWPVDIEIDVVLGVRDSLAALHLVIRRGVTIHAPAMRAGRVRGA